MTQIIATIGPATDSPEKIQKIIDAGVNFFRLNFSHGSHEWHKKTIATLRSVSRDTPIILDTKGPEMRTGDMPSALPEIFVEDGEILTLVLDESRCDFSEKGQALNQKTVFVNHIGLGRDVEKGDIISIDSGLIEVEVKNISSDGLEITTRVLHGGIISSRRHVNLVQKDVSLPTITPHDEEDIRFGLQQGVDILALSFLRCPTGVETVQKICRDELGEEQAKRMQIWGKIECQKGVDNIDILASVLDGMMVARGDLGVETPFEQVPYLQKKIVSTCQNNKIFSVVATEMLESMTYNPRPTRAEVTDVSLAVWQGANAVMLSGETAGGTYPEKTVQAMAKIVRAAEKSGVIL